MCVSPKNPWERQPGETAAPWRGFQVYRELGPGRTLVAAAGKLGIRPQTARRYSAKWRWGERAHAWDATVAAAQDQALLSELEKVSEEQLRSWRVVRQLSTTTILRVARKMAQDTDEGKLPTTLDQAVRFLEKSTTFERLIMGEATSREEHRKTPDYAKLEPGEAELLVRIMTKLGVEEL